MDPAACGVRRRGFDLDGRRPCFARNTAGKYDRGSVTRRGDIAAASVMAAGGGGGHGGPRPLQWTTTAADDRWTDKFVGIGM